MNDNIYEFMSFEDFMQNNEKVKMMELDDDDVDDENNDSDDDDDDDNDSIEDIDIRFNNYRIENNLLDKDNNKYNNKIKKIEFKEKRKINKKEENKKIYSRIKKYNEKNEKKKIDEKLNYINRSNNINKRRKPPIPDIAQSKNLNKLSNKKEYNNNEDKKIEKKKIKKLKKKKSKKNLKKKKKKKKINRKEQIVQDEKHSNPPPAHHHEHEHIDEIMNVDIYHSPSLSIIGPSTSSYPYRPSVHSDPYIEKPWLPTSTQKLPLGQSQQSPIRKRDIN